LVTLLEGLLIGHDEQRLNFGIMGRLMPELYLLGDQKPFPAVGAEFSGVQAGGLHHHG
jgi:hypothetical protein